MLRILNKITSGLLSATLMCVVSLSAAAQGGIPYSFDVADFDFNTELNVQQRPNYEAAKAEDEKNTKGPYRIGLVNDINDINLMDHAQVSVLPNGRVIYFTSFTIPDAKAVTVLFKDFRLPKGAKLHIFNKNRKQIQSFDHLYNDEFGMINSGIIAGATAFVELDLESQSLIEETSLTIEKLVAQYRGGIVADIVEEFNSTEWDYEATTLEDACHINAMCPQGDGFRDVMKTAVHLNYPSGGSYYVCSGNMINNATGDCKPYLLTASHCESTSSMLSSTFAQWNFVYNYQKFSCTSAGGGAGIQLTGGYFKSRSPYDDNSAAIIGDFLLLEVKDPTNKLGSLIKPYLGGWDRKATSSILDKQIAFHHPGGSAKKVTTYKRMYANGNFNGGAPSSHWAALFEEGGSEGGSSGSNLFTQKTKRIRGTLSGGVPGATACDTAGGRTAVYSKFNLNWSYVNGGDGTAKTRLKDWLDPTNTNVGAVNTVAYTPNASDCGVVGIAPVVKDINDYVTVFPNPSINGKLTLQVNINKLNTYTIQVVDVKGSVVKTLTTPKLASGKVKLDLSSLNSGIYFLKINSEGGQANKKIIIK